MATVYILYSQIIDTYFVDIWNDMELRLEEHRNGKNDNAFTKRSDDWVIHFSIYDLEYEVARKIEDHIKKMKSRKYIKNLILFKK